MKNRIGLVLLVAVFLVLAGCRNKPVYNVEQSPVITTVQNLSQSDIARAIKRAGGTLGWVMKDASESEIIGVLNLRKHMAKVSIRYTAEFYSIKYLDSVELGYDGSTIHNNYNGWIKNLDNGIQVQLNFF